MFTKAIFRGVLLTAASFHLAMGLPRMWAKRVVKEETGAAAVVGSAFLQATR